MSGRGRGRGRGRAPPTGARLLLQRSALEAGLDAGNLRNLQDITRPKLFPDYEWHSSGRLGHEETANETPATSTSAAATKRSASTVYLINKSREMHHRFQSSAFYVRPTQEVDVVRYGKRPRPTEPDIHVLEHMGKTADPQYVSEELLQKTGQAQLSMKELEDGQEKSRSALTLEEIAAVEYRKRKEAAAAAEEGDDGELSDVQDREDDEEEDTADYTTNYYASDDESDGGVGDEATF